MSKLMGISDFDDQIKNCKALNDDVIVKIVTDKKMASYIIEKHRYINQRDLKPKNLFEFHDSMKNDDFDFTLSPVIIAVLPNGDSYLIDGNHRLNVIAGVKELSDLDKNFAVLYSFVYMKTYDDVKDAYAKIDGGSTRTISDHVKSYNLAEVIGVSENTVSSATRALKRIRNGMDNNGSTRNRTRNTELKTLISNNKDIIRDFENIIRLKTINPKHRTVIKQQNFEAFCLIILREYNSKAKEFLLKTLDQTYSLSYNHPCFKLRQEIHDFSMNKNKHSNSTNILFNKFALAWKRFIDEKKLVNWTLCERVNHKGKIIRNSIPYTKFNKESGYSSAGQIVFPV